MDDRPLISSKLNSDKKIFYEWSDSFLRRQPVHELAAKIRTITTFDSSGKLLLECLIRACYDAHQWDDSYLHGSSERLQWRKQIASIKMLDDRAQNFLDALNSEDRIANQAMRYQDLDKSLNSSKLSKIKILIQDFQAGLSSMKDPDKIDNLNVCRDYQYGPFLLLDRYVLDNEPKYKDLRILGSLFQLTYIFRFFTSDLFDAKRLKKDSFLLIDGPMISSGKPYFNFVSQLINLSQNLTGDQSLDARQAKEKLRDFLNASPTPTPKSGKKTKTPFNGISWGGW